MTALTIDRTREVRHMEAALSVRCVSAGVCSFCGNYEAGRRSCDSACLGAVVRMGWWADRGASGVWEGGPGKYDFERDEYDANRVADPRASA